MTSTSTRLRILLCLGLLAPTLSCNGDGEPEDPFCGDGIVQDGEACDTGAALSDGEADACRTSCQLPTCGDGVADLAAGEICDDANGWGGDGCSPSCAADLGSPEQEPNDSIEEAQPISAGTPGTGALPAGDRDCYRIEVTEAGWLEADLIGDGEGTCPEDATLSLYSPGGSLVATGSPQSDAGCAPILPQSAEGARFMEGGAWTLCVEGFLGSPVPTYTLSWQTGEDSCALDGVPVLPADDADADGISNRCDEDDDDDGIADEVDNCPTVPNGPTDPGITTGSSGFIRHWLLAGPYFGNASEQSCLPSLVPLLGGTDDSLVTPRVGEAAGERIWFVHIDTNRRIDFEYLASDDAPREVYQVTWLYSDSARELTLAIGPDDGARIWLNGEDVGQVDGCQGTVPDRFRFPVELLAGWNMLLMRIYDHGGGWGNVVRFKDTDSNSPIDDLTISLSPDGPWTDNQGDQDGDGLGDFCDPEPTVPADD